MAPLKKRKQLTLVWIVFTLVAACAAPTPPKPPQPPNAQPTLAKPAPPTPAKPPLPTPTAKAAPAQPTATVSTAQPTASAALQRPENLQIGLNFILFFWSQRPDALDFTTSYLQPEAMFKDMKALGAQAYRQFVKADLMWDVVEPQDNQWNFAQADAVIPNPEFEPIVALFRMQYASPTPPWATSPEQFQKTLGPEAIDYLKTVVQRYAPYVKYWEVGNEMSYWRAADPDGQDNPDLGEALPPAYPRDGFSPREQGVFLAQAAAVIRQYDPDAVIVVPAIPSLSDYDRETWLPGMLEGGGKDWFDIFNYHDYGGWEQFTLNRPKLQQTLVKLGLDQKPVWNTETGSTSSATLTLRTDYPNSPETQAADVFRRIVQAWGHGDAFVVWHTYITSNDTGGIWPAYGLRTQKGQAQPAYAAFQLLTSELVPFATVEQLSSDARGVCAYKITTDAGAVKYVVWGTGRYTLPVGVTQQTSVIPAGDGSYAWQPAQAGQAVTLSPNPILIK